MFDDSLHDAFCFMGSHEILLVIQIQKMKSIQISNYAARLGKTSIKVIKQSFSCDPELRRTWVLCSRSELKRDISYK